MTPLNMIETVITEIIEATSLLEIIYSRGEKNPETDNAIACLIRSLNQTKNKASEYVLNSADASNSTNKNSPSEMKLPDNKVAGISQLDILKEALRRDAGNDEKNRRNADIINYYDAAIERGDTVYCFVSRELTGKLGLGKSST